MENSQRVQKVIQRKGKLSPPIPNPLQSPGVLTISSSLCVCICGTVLGLLFHETHLSDTNISVRVDLPHSLY